MSTPPNFDFNELMEKAKEMQTKMQEVQQKLAAKEIVGTSGGGLVKVHKKGNHYCIKTKIDPTLTRGLPAQDREMLEDLITAAINDAVDQIEKGTKDEISTLAGIDLPEGLGEMAE